MADRGGWRVDTGAPTEPRRYVFAAPCPGLGEVAATIADGSIPIKCCADTAGLAAALPADWLTTATGTMMVREPLREPSAPLPVGLTLDRRIDAAAGSVAIVASDGTVAASGHCGWSDAHFCFDRIVTAPEWRRRGLGRAVMQALGDIAAAQTRTWVLVATDAGRELYLTMGWRDVCPYSTATRA